MPTFAPHNLHSIAPWGGSCLIHAGLLLALMIEGAQQTSVSKALPPGKVTMNVPARLTARPKVTSKTREKRRAQVTSPDGKVALTRQENAKTDKTEVAPPQTAQEASGGGGTAVLTLKERYLFELRNRIEENKTYPAMAKRLGETGRVIISLSLLRDGSIANVTVKSSSSHERLDRAALETVKTVDRYEPIPDAIPNDMIAVEVPIEYAL